MLGPKRLATLLTIAALTGCGGTTSVPNAARVRFFDAFREVSNVRVSIGGRLYRADGKTSFEYGDGFVYADAPSGTDLSITANPYSDATSPTTTLGTQTLVEGAHYTLIGLTSGATSTGTATTSVQTFRLFRDSIAQTPDTQYLRVIHATSTHTPVYLRLTRKSDNTVVYASFTTGQGGVGLAVGNGTGYLPIVPANTTDSEDYTLQVYDAADFANELASATVTLNVDHPVTAIIYNLSKSSSDLRIKSGEDTVD